MSPEPSERSNRSPVEELTAGIRRNTGVCMLAGAVFGAVFSKTLVTAMTAPLPSLAGALSLIAISIALTHR